MIEKFEDAGERIPMPICIWRATKPEHYCIIRSHYSTWLPQFPTVYNKCKNNAIHWELEAHFCSDNNVRFWLRFSKNKRTTTKVIDHRDKKEVAVPAPLWSWSPSAWQCQSRWNGKQSVGCWIICSRCFVDNNSEFNLWSMYNIDSCKIIRKKCAKKGFDADNGMNE